MVWTPGVIFLFIGTFVLSLAFFLGGCNGVVASIVAPAPGPLMVPDGEVRM